MFEDLKNKWKKKREDRKKEKELLKAIEKEEAEIEASLPVEKKSTKQKLEDFWDLVLFDDDEEYKSLLTEKELEEYNKELKQNKKYTIRVTGILIGILVFLCLGMYIFYNTAKPEIYKVTLPTIEKYYQQKYNQKVKIDTIEAVWYYQDRKDNPNIRDKVDTDIVVATTKDNKHIVTIKNDIIGDDISNYGYINEYLARTENLFSSSGIISQEVDLYYEPYFKEFNKYEPYAHALPAGKTLDELMENKNLIVNYRIIYSGYLDINQIYTLLNQANDKSSFYLLKLESGLPQVLTTITKNSTHIMNITSNTDKEEGITYYQLDTEENNVGGITFTQISHNDMVPNGDYSFTYAFKLETIRVKRPYVKDETNEKQRSKNYLLRFKSGIINPSNLKQVDTYGGYGETGREELKLEKYKDVTFISGGGYTYLISDAKEIALAQTGPKKSFLCKLGIC